MSEYYAVIRSTDHLAHYGVKGMKWGVRKAIRKGNAGKLSKQYYKAERKLKKLNDRTNIAKQKELAKKHNKRAGIALGVGLAGAGAYTGNRLLGKYLKSKLKTADIVSKSLDEIVGTPARKKTIVGVGKGIEKKGLGLGTGPVGQNPIANRSSLSPSKIVNNVTAGIAGAGLATAAYQKGRALQAKYRTTKAGHAKAVAKRDAWKREMNKAFAGTKYDSAKKRRKSK